MLTEEEGIKAIIELQAVANIKEPEERARKAWESFTDAEKKQTEEVYNIMCK